MIYRELGRTGFHASALGLGGESALYTKSQQAVEIILRALEWGVNYFDTAPLYADSELNFGEVLPHRRQEMFIATKTDQRNYDAAWRQFEESLKRLQVDQVDLLQIHHLDFQEEVDAIFQHEGVVRMVQEAKDQGLTRFIGVTGHSDPEVLLRAIDTHPFDTILMALNPAEVHRLSFQNRLLPRAVELGMGIMAMKVFARGRLFDVPGMDAALSLDYVLSLPVDVAVTGVMNVDQLERNAAIVSNFRGPLVTEDMARLEQAAAPFSPSVNFYRADAETSFPEFEELPRETR